MRYLSVCSGIEAASCAWHPLGWVPVAFAEIDPFPAAVLAHRFPGVPNWGDMTKFKDWPDADVDVLVGGTPCQSFSVAGLRKGLDDPRGNLMLTYLAIAARYRPRWLVWENVPGVLSSNGGRDFGTFLGGLAELGYGFAYRVLDAQFVRVESHPRAVPQRRRRVFVVGCAGDWRRAAAVLLERESLLGHPAPRREAGEGTAAGTLRGTDGGSDVDHGRAGHLIAGSLTARGGRNGGIANDDVDAGRLICLSSGQANAEITRDVGTSLTCLHEAPIVAHSLRADGFDAREDGTGRGTPLVPVSFDWQAGGGSDDSFRGKSRSYVVDQPGRTRALTAAKTLAVAFSCKDHGADAGETAQTLRAMGHAGSHANAGGQVAVAFGENVRGEVRLIGGDGRVADPLATGGGKPGQGYTAIKQGMQVRRLTPLECERLQGFPDGWTDVPYRGKPAADGPRYRSLGNSMAVNVMSWIGQRIQLVDTLPQSYQTSPVLAEEAHTQPIPANDAPSHVRGFVNHWIRR